MVKGEYNGMTVEDPKLRAMFTREYLVSSDWYQERLREKQRRDVALWTRHVEALEAYRDSSLTNRCNAFDIEGRLGTARAHLAHVRDSSYLQELEGTIGADPRMGDC
jgi:hypothetical protein